MLTEDEANKKRCPQTMNRSITTPGDISWRCIASACMAWRSPAALEVIATPDTLHAADAKQANKMTPTPPEGAGWEHAGPYAGTPGWSVFRRQMPSDRGYCGLAGDPTK